MSQWTEEGSAVQPGHACTQAESHRGLTPDDIVAQLLHSRDDIGAELGLVLAAGVIAR